MQIKPQHDLPANVTEAVQSGLCVFAWPWGVEASFARLVEERSIVIAVIRVVQLHVYDATS